MRAGIVGVCSFAAMHMMHMACSKTSVTHEASIARGAGALREQGRQMVANIGLATPESVEYYAAEDVYLVTNINGSPLAADGNGFISKIRPDGTVVALKWIDGAAEGVTLHAPKGAAVVGETLYVADLQQVHLFALPSGAPKATVTIPNSTFLNGMAPGHGDFVYVTDSGLTQGEGGFAPSGTDAVYKVGADGTFTTVATGQDFGRPNGIVAMGDGVAVVSFGSGEVFSLNAEGQRTDLGAPPAGGLDGLLAFDEGMLVMSSWNGSALYVRSAAGEYTTLATGLDAPADLGFDSKRRRVLVPLFNQDALAFVSLNGAED